MKDFQKGQIPWNKGKAKVQDPNEIRTCKICQEQKIVTEFTKGKGDLYRYTCKVCRQNGRRTGLPNLGRFKPGNPHGKRFEAGHTPWYKVKGLPAPSKGKGKSSSKNSARTKDWTTQVKARDGWKCVKCESTNRVAAHHIVPWVESETLRFDVNNGVTLCCSCHAKEEGFKKGHSSWNKGTKGLLPTPWNKGKKVGRLAIWDEKLQLR